MDLWRLRQILSRAGYDCSLFNYHVWGKSPEKTARKLNDFVERIDAPVVHFVGHSFGGGGEPGLTAAGLLPELGIERQVNMDHSLVD